MTTDFSLLESQQAIPRTRSLELLLARSALTSQIRCSHFKAVKRIINTCTWSSPDLQMKTVRNHFMKRTFHMRKFKFVSDGVVLCESGGVLTQLHGQKMLLS
ncbi:hypothetical protein WJX82_001627 [Trebouxia sp. C0006]